MAEPRLEERPGTPEAPGEGRKHPNETIIYGHACMDAHLQGCTPAWMQVVEPRLEQAAEVVERRREQAAEGAEPRLEQAAEEDHSRAAAGVLPSGRIQGGYGRPALSPHTGHPAHNILSINDGAGNRHAPAAFVILMLAASGIYERARGEPRLPAAGRSGASRRGGGAGVKRIVRSHCRPKRRFWLSCPCLLSASPKTDSRSFPACISYSPH